MRRASAGASIRSPGAGAALARAAWSTNVVGAGLQRSACGSFASEQSTLHVPHLTRLGLEERLADGACPQVQSFQAVPPGFQQAFNPCFSCCTEPS